MLEFDARAAAAFGDEADLDLGRKFDLVQCLEVAEHLDDRRVIAGADQPRKR